MKTLGQAHVLVVDDFATMRDLIVKQLKSAGFEHIVTATSAIQALRLLDYKHVDLILSDWSMPGMSGLELLQEVRKVERLRHIPFIMVTAELHRERVAQAIKAGVRDFLLKPFKPVEFERKVTEALFGKSPNARLPGQALDTNAGQPHERARPTVLIVDDAPDNLRLASALLRDMYAIKLAPRGEKALQLCQIAPPDLILLDIMMPEMDGFEVCRRLKADPATAYIPVIFLTALADVEKTVAGFELGAVDYVAKPIEPEVLKARVATALRVSQAHEDLRAQYDLAVDHARLRADVDRITRHDLKNPIAAIIGMASGLLAGATLGEQESRQVSAIEQTAYDMLGLIDLSGDLLRMELGQYQLKPQAVDLKLLIDRVAQECRIAFSDKAVMIQTIYPEATPKSSCLVQGEALLLYSMLHNLAKNAAEAVQVGETVVLALDVDRTCHIRILNPGRVPAEMVERFFQKYASHGKVNGTGLGTFSAKLIAEAHRGAISMESSGATGVVVTVSLPCCSD